MKKCEKITIILVIVIVIGTAVVLASALLSGNRRAERAAERSGSIERGLEDAVSEIGGIGGSLGEAVEGDLAEGSDRLKDGIDRAEELKGGLEDAEKQAEKAFIEIVGLRDSIDRAAGRAESLEQRFEKLIEKLQKERGGTGDRDRDSSD